MVNEDGSVVASIAPDSALMSIINQASNVSSVGAVISINVTAAINNILGLVDGLSYGTYKIGTNVNDSVLNDGGCSCAGALSLSYYKALKLNNPSIELLPSDLRLSSALAGPVGSLVIEGRVIIPTYDINNNKIADIEYHVIRNLRHHCIIGNPILSAGVLSAYKKDRATLRFDPSYSSAVIKVRIHRNRTLNQNAIRTHAVHLVSGCTIPAGSMVRVFAQTKSLPGRTSMLPYSKAPSGVSPFNDGTEVVYFSY